MSDLPASAWLRLCLDKLHELRQSRASGDLRHLLWSQLGVKLLSLFAVTYAMRRLGPEGFGTAAYALGVTSVLGLLGNLGFDAVVPPAIAREADQSGQRRVGGEYFSLRLLLFFWFVPVLALGAIWNYTQQNGAEAFHPMEVAMIWFAAGMSLLGVLLNPQPIAQGMDQLPKLAKAQLWSGVLQAMLLLVSMTVAPSVTVFILVQSVGLLIVARPFFWSTGENSLLRLPSGSMTRLFQHLRASWPQILNVFVLFGLYTSDSAILAFCSSHHEVGLYAAALALVNGVNVFIATIPTVMFPRMIEWSRRSDQLLRRRTLWVTGLIMATLPLCYFATRVAGRAIFPLLLGDRFAESVTAFAALASCFVVGVAYAILGNCLVLLGRARTVLLTTAMSAGVALSALPWAAREGGAVEIAHAKLLIVLLGCVVAMATVWRCGVRSGPAGAPI